MYAISRTIVFLVATAAFVLSGGAAWAQSEGTIHGQVVAAADRSAVGQALVSVTSVSTGEALQTTADADGRFVFPRVRADQYVVSASANGFRTREVRLILEPREARALTVPLDVAGLDVSVSVTASVPALPSTHSPSSTVLTSARLDAMPMFERTTLPDAVVTSAPGMIRGHDDFVHIRGHEIALNPLINGVSFLENTHAVFSAGLSPDVIETANVMTGGFPAEYGNRFGGVVDIVTKSGSRMDHRGAVTFSGGSAGRRRADGEFGGAGRGLGYYLFGSLFETDRFLSPPDPEAFHDSATGGHVFATLDGNPGARGAFRAIVMVDGINAEIPKSASDEELRPQANADQRTRQQTAILGWTRAWQTVMMSASAYERRSGLRLLPAAGPLTARAKLTRDLLTVGAKTDLTRVTPRHAIKAGLDAVLLRPSEDLAYDYSGYRDLTHLAGLPHIHVTDQTIAFADRKSGGEVSGFVQDSVDLGARVSANVGLRVDRYQLVIADTHVSPRVNVAVHAGGGAVLHASYNHFFVPPAIEGVLSSSAGLTRSIREIAVPLPALKATIENQFEAGASAPWGPLQLGLTGYYRATDNPVHTTVWPDSRIYSYASFDRARAYGLEAKADAPALARYGVTGYVNYALGRVHFYNPVTGGFVTEAAHLAETDRFLAPMDQTHTLTGGATYRHAGTGIWLGTAVEYGSGTPIGHGGADHEHAEGEADHTHEAAGEAAARVPGHLAGNLSVGVDVWRGANRRPKLTLRVDVENVTNHAYLIARDSEFSPSQYSNPRLISATARIRF